MGTLTKEVPQAKGTQMNTFFLYRKFQEIRRCKSVMKTLEGEFAKSSCEWLEHEKIFTEITPIIRKTKAIDELKASGTRKQLKLLMSSLDSLRKFLPNLAEINEPLKQLLSQNNEFILKNECEAAFDSFKRLVANKTELKLFEIHRGTRIVCDASHYGLGAMLKQNIQDDLQPISFPSRYLNASLAVVWAQELYRNYVYGRFIQSSQITKYYLCY